MPARKPKELNTCIKDSRTFFKDVIKDTFNNLNISNLDNTEKATLRAVQAKWITKYKSDERMPEIPAPVPVVPRRTQNRHSVTFLPELPKKDIAPKKPRRSTVCHTVTRTPCSTNTSSLKHQNDQDTDQTQRFELSDISEVDDNEMIKIEFLVPKLMPDWPNRKLSVNVPSRAQKENMVEPCLTWDFLMKLMELPEADANRMLQTRVEDQLKQN